MKWTVPAGILACLAALAEPAHAQDMTAASIMTNFSSQERLAYLAGVVEGLAYARYRQDGEATDGMACIYDWFYDTPDTLRDIHATFDRFPDHTPGAVMAAMAERACGS